MRKSPCYYPYFKLFIFLKRKLRFILKMDPFDSEKSISYCFQNAIYSILSTVYGQQIILEYGKGFLYNFLDST